jgi:hypothetical protein
MMWDEPGRPTLRVIRGDATPEEVAAIVTVVMARSAARPAAEAPAQRTAPRWVDRAAAMRQPPAPGPGAWRASGFPR